MICKDNDSEEAKKIKEIMNDQNRLRKVIYEFKGTILNNFF